MENDSVTYGRKFGTPELVYVVTKQKDRAPQLWHDKLIRRALEKIQTRPKTHYNNATFLTTL